MKNLPAILKEVPGIGMVIIGEGDLSQDLGHPRQCDHPDVVGAIDIQAMKSWRARKTSARPRGAAQGVVSTPERWARRAEGRDEDGTAITSSRD